MLSGLKGIFGEGRKGSGIDQKLWCLPMGQLELLPVMCKGPADGAVPGASILEVGIQLKKLTLKYNYGGHPNQGVGHRHLQATVHHCLVHHIMLTLEFYETREVPTIFGLVDSMSSLVRPGQTTQKTCVHTAVDSWQ